MPAMSHQTVMITAHNRCCDVTHTERNGFGRDWITAKYEQEFTKPAFDIAVSTGSAVVG